MVLVLLLSASVSADHIELGFVFPEPVAYQGNGGIQYDVQGTEFTAVPGEPRLPVRRELVRIPINAVLMDVTPYEVRTETIGSVKNIAISKQPVIKTACRNSSSFTEAGIVRGNSPAPASARIQSASVFPDKVYSFRVLGGFDDYKIVSVSVFPLQYDGGKLLFHRRVSLRIEYESPSRRITDGSSTIMGRSSTGKNGTKYLIITDSSLNSSLQPLKEWKTKKGVPAEIYSVQWIYQNYNGTMNYVFHSGTGYDRDNYLQRTLNLSNSTTANLTFSTKFNIEEGWDFGYVEVSLDGKNWSQLKGRYMSDYREPQAYVGTPGAYSYTGTSSWVRDSINLSNYTGKNIYLRFHYVTDTHVSFGGWWLDNISVKTEHGILFSAEGNSTGGWNTSGFSVMDINAYENPPQKLIRDFITDKHTEGAEWVLLAGGDDLIPSLRVSRLWYLGDNDSVPTDYYYSCLDGDWNSDWDPNYGENEHPDVGDEIQDWIPDIYVGRIPVSTASEMKNIVSTIIEYEKSPPMNSSEWFSRALLAGGVADDVTDDAYLMELLRTNLLEPENFSDYRLYYSGTYPRDAQLTYPAFEKYIGYGNSIITWVGHGFYTEAFPCPDCSAFVDLETSPLNDGMLPFVYADSCMTGAFDQTNSLGNHVLKTWAIGYIGSSRSSYYSEKWNLSDGFNQDMLYRFVEQFLNGSYQPGKAIAEMKGWYYLNQWPLDDSWGGGDASKKNLLQYTLLGDPEIPIWTSAPENFTVGHPIGIYPGENSIVVDVNDSSGGPVDGARVCIQGSGIYSYGYTNSSGRVEFKVSVNSNRTLNLTVTMHNFIPYEANISVITDSDPPEWDSTIGIQRVTPGDGYVTAEWNSSSDASQPVRYNLYYDTTREWLCQCQNVNISRILQTEFDLVVLDPDDLNSSQVEELKSAGKFVLAYINIGRAENWRSYWNSSWETGNPEWLLDEAEVDGVYYVDYSLQEWQSIVHDYLDEIRAKGFSGAYLDNIETGYQRHESNLSDPRYENCTRENMMEFIMNISLTHRSGKFLIFPHNGLDIALNLTDYIDGIVAGGVYYSDTGSPVGAELTGWKEAILNNLTDKGKLALTLDYTENQTEIDLAYNRSLGRGYVPYVSVAALDQLIINEGHEPKPVAETGIKIKNATCPYTVQNLTNGMIYYFSVRAEDAVGNEDTNNVALCGVPFQNSGCGLSGDTNCDGRVSDFELLDYINQWSNGKIGDFDLLEAINNWMSWSSA